MTNIKPDESTMTNVWLACVQRSHEKLVHYRVCTERCPKDAMKCEHYRAFIGKPIFRRGKNKKIQDRVNQLSGKE